MRDFKYLKIKIKLFLYENIKTTKYIVTTIGWIVWIEKGKNDKNNKIFKLITKFNEVFSIISTPLEKLILLKILNGKNSNEVNTREKKIICKNSLIFLLKNSNP